MQKNIDIHIGKIILDALEKEERSAAWLARKVHIDRSNLHRQLKHSHINTKLLYNISTALNIDFFHHYSALFKQKTKCCKNRNTML
jgi:hypothetical protein